MNKIFCVEVIGLHSHKGGHEENAFESLSSLVCDFVNALTKTIIDISYHFGDESDWATAFVTFEIADDEDIRWSDIYGIEELKAKIDNFTETDLLKVEDITLPHKLSIYLVEHYHHTDSAE